MDIFISYSRKDKAFVQKLHQALKQRQKDSWVDWEDIPLTADWWAEIQEGIEGTDAFIFVISPDSVSSKVCSQEIEHAVKHNKRLIPIVFRDTKAAPEALRQLNWIFFRETDDFDAAFNGLLEVIDTDLDWVKRHTQLIQRAVEWEKKERNESYLLYGDNLAEAEQHLLQSNRNPSLTQLQQEYIVASQQKQATDLMRELEQTRKLAETEKRRLEEQKRYNARLRKQVMIIIAGLVLVIILGGYSTFRTYREGELAHSAEEVIQAVVEYADAETNNDVCWAGALYGVPHMVMSACEQAVTLEPKVSFYYESRGLTHALMGDFSAADADFKAAIEIARESRQGEERIGMWETWAQQIGQKRNPFNEGLLQRLRNDWKNRKTDS